MNPPKSLTLKDSVLGICCYWFAVKELKGLGFRVYYPPKMENHMEKKMENEMEAGGI